MTRRRLWIDIETYSPVDLKKHGVYAYAAHPEFEILMAAWSTDGKTVQVAIGDEVNTIPGLWNPEVEKVAHNAPFERICFSAHAGLPQGQFFSAEEWNDTAARAGVFGYPQSLGKLAIALGAEEKDEAGTRLINLFCKPNRKGERYGPVDKPEQWQEFVDYCAQDVYTLIDVDRRLPEMPEAEWRVYLTDQAINDRGIRVDLDLARWAVECDQANRTKAEAEMRDLLGISNAGSVQQITAALAENGLELDDLRAATVKEALGRDDLTPTARRALELRQGLALVASRKYETALGATNADGRLRGQFRYFGAHTGRWSGKGVQLQNLPKAQAAQPEAAILDLALGLGADSETLKGLVRSMFVGPFTVVDYSAIEARVLAWLAGEQWMVDAFHKGRDIYVETAERMSTPDHPLTRQQGKVAVLALGYQGGVESLRGMGADGTDAELDSLKVKYRRTVPRIVRTWSTLEQAFKRGGTAGRLEVRVDGTDRLLVLPSGRSIVYRKVSARGGRITFQSPLGPRTDTYGGRLTENATQAVSRDLLAEALVRLEERGYHTVGHVHDEVIEEGEDVAGVESALVELPAWAKGLPMAAEGFTCSRYRKG